MKKATVAILLALSTVSSAQEPPSSTTEREHHEVSESSKQSTRPPTIRVDRPSFANSSHVVGAGVHSLESGVLVTTTKQESHALVQAPLLYRVGINQELEFRLGTTSWNIQNQDVGWADITPGMKWNFHSDDALSVSLVASLEIPVGHHAFRSAQVTPSLSLAADVPVSSQTSLLFNTGVSTNGRGRDLILQPFVTAGVGQSLSSQWSLYLEGAAFGPDELGASSTTAGDLVLAYLINEDTQLDIAAFKGFSSSGLDWALTLGIATRW